MKNQNPNISNYDLQENTTYYNTFVLTFDR